MNFIRTFARLALLVVVTLGKPCVSSGATPPELSFVRATPLSVPAAGKAGFVSMPPSGTGVWFTNLLPSDRHLTNQIYLNGSGVAAGDVDGDGRCDLYFCGLNSGNALFRNLGAWRFEEIARSAGVDCPGLDCTGAALADLDGDTDLDLIVNTVGQGTHLFLNDGKGVFASKSGGAPINAGRGGMSLALADVDGDADLDLYVVNYRTWTLRDHPQTRMSFQRVNGEPVMVRFGGRPATDPDLVGRITLHGGRIVEHGEPDRLLLNNGRGEFQAVSFTGGAFLDDAGQSLRSDLYDWGLSAMFRDLNGDGAPDLYVCNDFGSPDRLWINAGGARFRAIDSLALRHTSRFSMGVDFADINRDGHDDFFVVDMMARDHAMRHRQLSESGPMTEAAASSITQRPQVSRNTLFLNQRDGTFAEIAQYAGVPASDWSWMPAFLDVDLDGFEDILVTTGHEREALNADIVEQIEVAKRQSNLSPAQLVAMQRHFPRLPGAKVAFRNRGDLTFEDTTVAWGLDVRTVSHGMALADLDSDGDLDLAINNLNSAASLFRNDSPAPRIAVRLNGASPNTHGIGARIRVTGGPVPQSQEMIAGGRYLSSDDSLRVFAASENAPMEVEVIWRSGRQTRVNGLGANQLYEIDERSALTNGVPRPAAVQHHRWFEDVTGRLHQHQHQDEPFTGEFERQRLLPKRLSQLGPGVSWGDLNGDGAEDLVIPGGKGGALGIFTNDFRGGFQPERSATLSQPVTRDQTTALVLPRNSGPGSILVASANWEDGLPLGAVVRSYHHGTARFEEVIAGLTDSVGAMALADLDADGDLDLFVGGRAVPGRYPEAASSFLYRNENGRYLRDESHSAHLQRIGLVSGAVFTDLNGDGFPELVLASEWGPIQIFRNDNGRLTIWNPKILPSRTPLPDARGAGSEDGGQATVRAAREMSGSAKTLSKLTGWWNSVASGDFNGDGRLDLVAGNWGLNHRHHMLGIENLRFRYGDLAGNGAVELLEAYHDHALQKTVPFRGFKLMSEVIPGLRDRLKTFAAYATAGVDELLPGQSTSLRDLNVATFATVVLLNHDGHFEVRELPFDAQVAPVFGLSVGDGDGDGREDIFAAQNFFGLQPELARLDAGRGVWLKGDGTGGFRALPPSESGVALYGEQRGSALSDFDRDGRLDLAVAQNSAETKLFRNTGARPGLRVRLSAGRQNPAGVGAVLRARSGDRIGPAREIRAGSGYWSQDSATQVMCDPETIRELDVRWPGGQTKTYPVPAGATEVTLSP